jgi:CheY-like chemotaxis protein
MADSTRAGARILVVDDDPAIGGLIAAILGKDGYTVLVAKSGSEGLSMATAEHPHLILMDITMPDMDGYEATQKLKATPGMKDIPVIFLTGRSASEDGGRAFGSGGLTFMRKPFTAQQLRDLVSLAVQSLGV